ncbi:MAG: hypothetical protein ACW986_18350 [Promethearchaeota archaeon]|jgi:hypothetical protein
MVHIEIISWYPRHKNQEATEKFLELMKDPGMPSVIKSFKIYSKAAKEGIKVMAYLEVEDEKLGQALIDIDPLLFELVQIEGYNIEFGIVYSFEEVMAARQQG